LAGTLHGHHRQVVDAYEVNAGFPLGFAYTFLLPNKSATDDPTHVLGGTFGGQRPKQFPTFLDR
jgi:hypothetical protein